MFIFYQWKISARRFLLVCFRPSLATMTEREYALIRSIHQFMQVTFVLIHEAGDLVLPSEWSCMDVLGVSSMNVVVDR